MKTTTRIFSATHLCWKFVFRKIILCYINMTIFSPIWSFPSSQKNLWWKKAYSRNSTRFNVFYSKFSNTSKKFRIHRLVFVFLSIPNTQPFSVLCRSIAELTGLFTSCIVACNWQISCKESLNVTWMIFLPCEIWAENKNTLCQWSRQNLSDQRSILFTKNRLHRMFLVGASL